jgi:peptidoglycan hydrolase-like protein with peptidoglycan-binding domain
MTEGVFPKSDGEVFYASEVNNLNFSFAEHTEESGPYSHTGDTNQTPLRTYTIGGISGKGAKLIFLTFTASIPSSGATLFVSVNYQACNPPGSTNATFGGGLSTGTRRYSIPISLEDSNIVRIEAQLSSDAQTVSISNIKFWTTDMDITITGS